MELKVGDKAVYCGANFTLIELRDRAALDNKGKPIVVVIATLDNDDQKVKCRADELRYSEEDKAWYLPGMLLSHRDRDIYAQAIGNGIRPRPENHFIARRLLKQLTAEEYKAAGEAVERKRA